MNNGSFSTPCPCQRAAQLCPRHHLTQSLLIPRATYMSSMDVLSLPQLAEQDPGQPRSLSPPGPTSMGEAHAPIPEGPTPFENQFRIIMECADPLGTARHGDSVSFSSLSVPASPIGSMAPAPLREHAKPSSEAGIVEDRPWNLVAYHIPWGSTYEGYKSGTLPGPDGPCIFLRSPTPSKKQRTSQACEQCRERKAKCSGTRPICARCDSRGHPCVYTTVGLSGSPPASPLIQSCFSPSPDHPGDLKAGETWALRKDSPLVSEGIVTTCGTREGCRGIEHGVHGEITGPDSIGSHDLAPEESPSNLIVPPPVLWTPATLNLSPALSSKSPSPPGMFPLSLCGSTHALNNGTVNPLYIGSGSGLDAFCLSPPASAPGSAEAFTAVHPQYQSLNSQLLPQPVPPSSTKGLVVDNIPWFGDGSDHVWEEELPVLRLLKAMDFYESSSAVETSSMAPFASYSRPLSHCDTGSQPSCCIASDCAFLDTGFSGSRYPVSCTAKYGSSANGWSSCT